MKDDLANLKQNLTDNVISENLSAVWNFTLFKDKAVGVNLTVGNLLIALFFVIIGQKIAKRVSRGIKAKFLTRFIKDRNQVVIYESLAFYLVFLFFFLIALKIAHIPLTIFTLVGGALAIGIGFGSQNLVNNFISGIIMMIEEPIKIGDYIEVEGLAGTVEEIGARSTKIISLENKHYIVPNSSFLEKNVLNWTLNNNFIRTEVAVGVAYGTDATKVKEILMGIAKDTDNIRNYPEPFVLFDDFGDSALVFKLVYWFDLRVIPSVFMSRSDLRFRIDKAFKENKITIAFPQQDIHFHKPIEVRMKN
jgi:potassium efflux system protein